MASLSSSFGKTVNLSSTSTFSGPSSVKSPVVKFFNAGAATIHYLEYSAQRPPSFTLGQRGDIFIDGSMGLWGKDTDGNWQRWKGPWNKEVKDAVVHPGNASKGKYWLWRLNGQAGWHRRETILGEEIRDTPEPEPELKQNLPLQTRFILPAEKNAIRLNPLAEAKGSESLTASTSSKQALNQPNVSEPSVFTSNTSAVDSLHVSALPPLHTSLPSSIHTSPFDFLLQHFLESPRPLITPDIIASLAHSSQGASDAVVLPVYEFFESALIKRS